MELKDNSQKIRQDIQRRLAAGLNRGNEFLIDESASAAPVKSGNLRDNTEIVSEATPDNLTTTGASKAEYAAHVNRHIDPFWLQAWLRMKDQFGEFFRNG